jgi:hypothetical protein
MRKFTEAEIEACKTKKGGFSNASTRALGVPWPLKKGWKKRMTMGSSKRAEKRREVAGAIEDENDRYIREAQRGALPIDLNQRVKQVFFCRPGRHKCERTEILRTLIHISSEPPTCCPACAPAPRPGEAIWSDDPPPWE